MVWTSSLAGGSIRVGPFIVGVGVAGSEIDLGETQEMNFAYGYEISEIKAGDFLGTETLIDAIPIGIKAVASFMLGQYDTADLKLVSPLATLSAGAVSKSLTPEHKKIMGQSLLAQAARIRFHKASVADKTDETEDIIFPAGIVIPTTEEYTISPDDKAKQPCMILAFYDATTDAVVVFGEQAA